MLPYHAISFSKSQSTKIELIISTWTSIFLPWVHRGIGTFVEGYSSESEEEVDVVHLIHFEVLDLMKNDDIMTVCRLSFLLVWGAVCPPDTPVLC